MTLYQRNFKSSKKCHDFLTFRVPTFGGTQDSRTVNNHILNSFESRGAPEGTSIHENKENLELRKHRNLHSSLPNLSSNSTTLTPHVPHAPLPGPHRKLKGKELSFHVLKIKVNLTGFWITLANMKNQNGITMGSWRFYPNSTANCTSLSVDMSI
jgi:hypothetical protein